MNRNRLLIIISSAVAILGAFLPWASVSAGFFGAMSIRGTQGDGTFIAVLGVIAIVLACLQDNKTALPRNFATGVAVIGALQTLIMLINLLNLSRVFGSQGAALKSYGVSVHIGIGFLFDLLAGIATAVF
ncbi:MAG: lantibiotic ABC transporter permease, partial [Stomatobaculum longum]|nr:lantibiotic ABC transporter permease [Stomatobaculum longum]